jgi:nicotinamidase-related amidase
LVRPSNNCLVPPGAEPGPNSGEIDPELAPRPEALLVRGPTYDKFYGTPLDLARRSQDIRYLVIVGVVTEISMNGKLLSAANCGYRVPSVTHGVARPEPDVPRDPAPQVRPTTGQPRDRRNDSQRGLRPQPK